MRIGLLSDTHSYLDPGILKLFSSCDEIWHAGDIGDEDVVKKLARVKLLRAVTGNIDGNNLRTTYPEDQFFTCEGMKVLITHIGGSPGNYYPEAKQKLLHYKPGLFICGHSHILKVMHDKEFNMLYMNPGAAGKHGFHKIKTVLRFDVLETKVQNLEVIELGPRSAIV